MIQKISDKEYTWYTPEVIPDIKVIPLQVPDGKDAQRVSEKTSIAMRLLYR